MAYTESGIAERDHFAHSIDVWARAMGPHLRLGLWWGCAETPDYYDLWSKHIARSSASLKNVATSAYARGSVKDLILSAIELADQPPGVLAGIAGQAAELRSIAETYYRVWCTLQSLCPLEFLLDAV